MGDRGCGEGTVNELRQGAGTEQAMWFWKKGAGLGHRLEVPAGNQGAESGDSTGTVHRMRVRS